MSDLYGPFIPASPIYFGTTYLTQKTLRTVERYPNGAIPGARNKHLRRILRATRRSARAASRSSSARPR
jgi:hypothetical protein